MKRNFLCLFLAILFSSAVFAQTQIDEYGPIISDDESARLFNFAEQLKNDEANIGTIVIHKDKSETTGRFLRHFYGVKDFLIEAFDIAPKRFSIVFGGEDVRRTQIWLSKSKKEASKFESKILDETLAGKISRRILFDYNCLDCDESPFVNQFIFREGIDYLANALRANSRTKAIIKIGGVEYLSKSSKEKKDLLKNIFERLEKNKIRRNRVAVQFTSGMLARFYIIPVKRK